MKKLATLIFVSYILSSCIRQPSVEGTIDHSEQIDGAVVKIIDSCQYIEIYVLAGDASVYSLTHKGNCNNPIHTKR